MSQIGIIAQREYLQRVRSRAFIIATALGPVLMLLVLAVPIVMAVFSRDDSARVIAVVDQTGEVAGLLSFPDNFDVLETSDPVDTLRSRVDRGQLEGYLVLPDDLVSGSGEARYYSKGGGGILLGEQITDAVRAGVREARILRAGAPAAVLEIMKDRVPVRMIQLTDDGERTDSTQVLAVFGYFMGFLIYLCVILYGAIVMRGVIEEKTSRISELIASSAKPFDLMMGKVLGIGAMGLTQWLIWIGAGIGLSAAAAALVAGVLPDGAIPTDGAGAGAAGPVNPIAELMPDIPLMFPVYFILFFLGGYLLYSSLMAAIGSAVEQEADAQQFMWIVIMPLIIPMVMIVNVMSAPDGMIATTMSMIPLFSPIVMVVRMAATNVPWWEVWLSLILLACAFLLAIWVSSRIYRVGILSYGKKPTFKELARWMRQA